MATPNPLASLYPNASEVSRQVHIIGGIEVDVYGRAEIHSNVKNVACLWLHNPRLCSKEDMRPIANAVVTYWKKQNDSEIGIIVAAFDQRNHGTRLTNPSANDSWRDGNPRHAQDMFSIYQGTAADTSQLITYLSGYVFPRNEHKIVNHMVLGISLGGHSAWQVLLHEPRVTTGISIVGCPDYVNLMSERAKLSKIAAWTQSSPPGSSFLGSESFPDALLLAIGHYDPAGYYFGAGKQVLAVESNANSRKKQSELFDQTLKGKRILNLSGGADRLVPYSKAKPFMTWLQEAVSPTGWYKDGKIVVKDIVYEGVGHETTSEMLQECLSFLAVSLKESSKSASAKI